ncbi:MAG: sugar transferase [Coriobacteriales bacterium]|nr:sugar transferase [Coriobacteriales bacterium]
MEPTRSLARHVRRVRITAALVACDALAIVAAGLSASQIRFGSVNAPIAIPSLPVTPTFLALTLAVTIPWLLIFNAKGLYDLDRLRLGFGDLPKILEALAIGTVGLIFATYAAKLPGLSRLWLVLMLLFCAAGVATTRVGLAIALAVLRRMGRLTERTLVVGSNGEAADIVRIARRRRYAGLNPVGCLTSSQAERLGLDHIAGDIPCLGHAREVVRVVSEHQIDTVVIAGSAFDHDVLARIIAELRQTPVTVHVSSGLFDVLASRVLVNEVAGVPLITVKGAPLSRGRLLLKRAFDLAVAGAIVAVGLPLWAGIAIAIKLTSRGPVFYRQERVGRSGRTFGMLKFRSMYADADERLAELLASNEANGPLFKMKDDPRVTPVGRWMRKFSLDEFPQLLNVLAGEMSLVGPRPPLPREAAEYTEHAWRRLDVVPGMTGLWQVSGRSSLTFEEMVRLDLFYIENWSVGLDLALMARTVPAVLLARGAY